jgi:hypothetical protein
MELQQESMSLLSIFRWLRQADHDSNFELSIDVDGPKLFIFLNTVMMNNISISKKLSHSNSYISQQNPEHFKFDLRKIFARKPMKKIQRNVISKFTRLAVAKLLMKYQLLNTDDVVFVFILCLHQLCFLYYAQMNCESNYLKYFKSSQTLTLLQQIVKRFSKGISLLVKVNGKFVKSGASHFSLKIFSFLGRMQLAQGIKHFLIMKTTKKKTAPDYAVLKELQLAQFYRVSLPTIILYVCVVLL